MQVSSAGSAEIASGPPTGLPSSAGGPQPPFGPFLDAATEAVEGGTADDAQESSGGDGDSQKDLPVWATSALAMLMSPVAPPPIDKTVAPSGSQAARGAGAISAVSGTETGHGTTLQGLTGNARLVAEGEHTTDSELQVTAQGAEKRGLAEESSVVTRPAAGKPGESLAPAVQGSDSSKVTASGPAAMILTEGISGTGGKGLASLEGVDFSATGAVGLGGAEVASLGASASDSKSMAGEDSNAGLGVPREGTGSAGAQVPTVATSEEGVAERSSAEQLATRLAAGDGAGVDGRLAQKGSSRSTEAGSSEEVAGTGGNGTKTGNVSAARPGRRATGQEEAKGTGPAKPGEPLSSASPDTGTDSIGGAQSVEHRVGGTATTSNREGGKEAGVSGGELAEQVASRAATLSLPRNSRMRIQLKPPELGFLDLRLSLRDGAVTLHISAESARTRDLIQTALPQLQRALEERSINVSDFSLGSGSGPGLAGGWANGSSASGDLGGQWLSGQRRMASGAPGAGLRDGGPADETAARHATRQGSEHLVDYRV